MKSIASAKSAFKAAEKEYYEMAKAWAEIQSKALDKVAKLEAEIEGLQRELQGANPSASQEDSDQYWDEIPHAIHALQTRVDKIKAQLNA